MTPFRTPLFALALAALINVGTAHAQDAPSPTSAAPAGVTQTNDAPEPYVDLEKKALEPFRPKPEKDFRRINDGIYGAMDDETFEKFKAMSLEERRAFLKSEQEKKAKMSLAERNAMHRKKVKEFQSMTPEQLKERHQKRKAWFESLPEEEKLDMKVEAQKAFEERRASWQKMSPEEKAARKKEREEMFNSLSSEEKERLRDRREYLKNKKGSDAKPEMPSAPPAEEKAKTPPAE